MCAADTGLYASLIFKIAGEKEAIFSWPLFVCENFVVFSQKFNEHFLLVSNFKIRIQYGKMYVRKVDRRFAARFFLCQAAITGNIGGNRVQDASYAVPFFEYEVACFDK